MAGRQNWRKGLVLSDEERAKLSKVQKKLKTRARKVQYLPTGQIYDSVHALADFLDIGYHALYSRIRRDRGKTFKLL
jgi:hypothetical protein